MMTNNDFGSWMDEFVAISNVHGTSKSVRFSELLPILQEKPDVMEETDSYGYFDNASLFIVRYNAIHQDKGYGAFTPDI